jgi:DNA-binding NarL/FixJ family response regulator
VRKTRIFMVDDHPLVRESLRLLLGREPDFSICGEATQAREALRKVPIYRPDLVLIDVSLPDMSGVALAAELHRRDGGLVLAMLSAHDDDHRVDAAFHAGARGYIVKGSTAELAAAVRQLIGGAEYLSPVLSRPGVRGSTRRPARPAPCRPTYRAVPAAPAPGGGDGCALPGFSGRPRGPRHRR